ncbi:hypothetical protein QUF64_08270 [Anaerolineales bacterium HSG6]|nr:hypothetical protein [Anaerolineales bacterium HSG6]
MGLLLFIDLDDHVILNEGRQVEIQFETDDRTPAGTYIIPVTAESDGQPRSLMRVGAGLFWG